MTLVGEFNYGNLLQAYALQTVLERLGHDSVILNRRSYRSAKLLFLRVLSFIKSVFRRYLLSDKGTLVVNPFAENYTTTSRTDNSELRVFATKYLKRTSPLCSTAEMNRFAKKEHFDVYVVGSDQVWREEYTQSIEEMFLSFLPDSSKARRIAYAASFGTDSNPISSEKLSVCASLLNQFNAISVREKSAIDICKEMSGVESVHVLDPTMLLYVIDYKVIFDNVSTPNSPGTLLTYVLDNDDCIKNKIEYISQKYGLLPFSVNAPERVESRSYSYRQPSIEAWLRGFHDAEFVITDSFHACVFSILFHKPFICIGNKNRGMSRFDSLLGMFGLEDRLVDVDDIEGYVEKEIDWERVDQILEVKREEAFQFLNQALKE